MGVCDTVQRERTKALENQEADILFSVEKALTELEKRPGRSVRARLRGLDIEMRVVNKAPTSVKLGDLLASLGPWAGESAEELSRFLAGSRKEGGKSLTLADVS
jgi:hypothetical protein